MKILALMTFDIFRLSLGAALEHAGHEVRYLGDFNAGELDAVMTDFRPDMVVDMGWDVWQQDKHYRGELHTIYDVLQRHRVFHLYFAEEDWLHYERWSERYCSIMRPSFVLTRSPLTIRKYEAMGISATYFDVGCNPEFHKPSLPQPQYACDVAVVATGNFTLGELRYKSIGDLVVPLLDRQLDVKIWGRDWENMDWCYPGKKVPAPMLQGKLSFPETPVVYNSAKICISIQTSKDQLSNRTLDILSSGGFLLTSDTKAVREKLRPGIDCVVSGSPEETVRLVEYYLKHEAERRQIAAQGLITARERFAYQKTLMTVWPEIEGEWRAHQLASSRPDPKNLLVNGDFKQPAAEAWICHHADQEEAYGYGGRGSIRFKGGDENAYIQQTVSLVPDKTYLLTAWFAKQGTEAGAPINIIVQYYTGDHRLIEFGLYHSLFPTDLSDVNTNVWFGYRGITTKVPAEATYAWILINKISHEDSSPILVSNCEFREIEV